MANPGVIILSTAKIPNNPKLCAGRLQIEDNIGEGIHIHYRNFRLDFTIRDFHRVADAEASIAELYHVVGDFQLKNQPKKSLRRTFLINNQMNIIGFFDEIQPNHHINDVLEILSDVDGYLDLTRNRISTTEESL